MLEAVFKQCSTSWARPVLCLELFDVQLSQILIKFLDDLDSSSILLGLLALRGHSTMDGLTNITSLHVTQFIENNLRNLTPAMISN